MGDTELPLWGAEPLALTVAAEGSAVLVWGADGVVYSPYQELGGQAHAAAGGGEAW